jgi:peptidase M48
MEQDPRLRQMSREENAAYRGVTVDESGAEPQDDAREQSGEAYSGGPRTSVRYVRIGGTTSRSSLLTSLLWSIVLAVFLIFFFFVALPAIVIVMVSVLVVGLIVSIIGRERIMSWIMRRLYGR